MERKESRHKGKGKEGRQTSRREDSPFPDVFTVSFIFALGKHGAKALVAEGLLLLLGEASVSVWGYLEG